jgi:hypothetical protein
VPHVIEHKGERVGITFDHAAVARNRERIGVVERAAANSSRVSTRTPNLC